jgi:hypothetical protein
MNTYIITATITRSNGRSELKGEEKSISPTLALLKFVSTNDIEINEYSSVEINFTIKKA